MKNNRENDRFERVELSKYIKNGWPIFENFIIDNENSSYVENVVLMEKNNLKSSLQLQVLSLSKVLK